MFLIQLKVYNFDEKRYEDHMEKKMLKNIYVQIVHVICLYSIKLEKNIL